MTEAGRPDPVELPSEKIIALRDALEDHGVPYAFGGAVALFYYRDPRSTTDIDINIFLPPDRKTEVLEVLQTLYPIDADEVGTAIEATGQTRSEWGATYIDLFFSDTDFHTSMSNRVRREPFLDREMNVLSAEDLLVCKMLFDRPKDWLDVEAVVTAQGDTLDRRYVELALGLFVDAADRRFERWREVTGGG